MRGNSGCRLSRISAPKVQLSQRHEATKGGTSTSISFRDPRSEELVASARHSGMAANFDGLLSLVKPQYHPTACSLASSAAVLNGIETRANRPALFAQEQLLDRSTDFIKTQDAVAPPGATLQHTALPPGSHPGMTLEQLASVLRVKGQAVTSVHASDVSVDAFRDSLKASLSDPSKWVIANFYGRDLGLDIGGHFSPIAAYDPESDRVLIADVAAHKTAWHWETVASLHDAMTRVDETQSRGLLVVDSGPQPLKDAFDANKSPDPVEPHVPIPTKGNLFGQ